MMSSMTTIEALRRALLALLVLGSIGTVVELLLLKHTDGVWQLTPILLSGGTLLALAWFGVAHSRASLRALQAVMLLALVSGGIGVVQHFRSNLVYASESNPSLTGWALYLEAVMGSNPTLAPGVMVQLALIGLAYCFRHPTLRGAVREDDHSASRIEP